MFVSRGTAALRVWHRRERDSCSGSVAGVLPGSVGSWRGSTECGLCERRHGKGPRTGEGHALRGGHARERAMHERASVRELRERDPIYALLMNEGAKNWHLKACSRRWRASLSMGCSCCAFTYAHLHAGARRREAQRHRGFIRIHVYAHLHAGARRSEAQRHQALFPRTCASAVAPVAAVAQRKRGRTVGQGGRRGRHRCDPP